MKRIFLPVLMLMAGFASFGRISDKPGEAGKHLAAPAFVADRNAADTTFKSAGNPIIRH